MNPYKSGTGWCELWMRKVWKDVDVSSLSPEVARRRRFTQRQAYHELGSGTLRFYDEQWGHELTFTHRAPSPHGFTYRGHGTGQDDTGGHNWYMTTRFDVWFVNPFSGREWHGWLITGGCNSTFRVRSTQASPLFAYDCPAVRLLYPDFFQAQAAKPTHARRRFLRRPRIEHVELGDDQFVLRVLDGEQERFYAKAFPDGWHYGLTVGDVFASRLCRRQAA